MLPLLFCRSKRRREPVPASANCITTKPPTGRTSPRKSRHRRGLVGLYDASMNKSPSGSAGISSPFSWSRLLFTSGRTAADHVGLITPGLKITHASANGSGAIQRFHADFCRSGWSIPLKVLCLSGPRLRVSPPLPVKQSLQGGGFCYKYTFHRYPRPSSSFDARCKGNFRLREGSWKHCPSPIPRAFH
jgi:hypothetical protein